MKKLTICCILCLWPSLSAHAAEWEFELEGHGRGVYGYSDYAERFERLNKNNHGIGAAEVDAAAIYAIDDETAFSLHLDLMGGIDRELQNYNQGRWGEEAYAIADSPYGRILLGQTYNVGAQFYDGAPTVGALKSNADVADFIRNPNWQRTDKTAKFATLDSVSLDTDGVAPKISYVSPEWNGMAAGFSYVPDAYNRRGLINKHTSYARKDGYVGAVYVTHEVKGLNIDASAAAARYHDNDAEFATSLQFGYGNWTLGGGWRKTYIDGHDKQKSIDERLPELFDNYREGEAWEAGLGYEIGPLKATLAYFEAEAERTANRDRVWTLSGQYQATKNIDVYLAAAHADFEGENNDLADNNQGWAFVAGAGVNF